MRPLSSFVQFLKAIGRSCYDMEFYRGVRTRPMTRAVSYFAAFSALLVVLGIALFAPAFVDAMGRVRQWTAAHLADGASFTLRGGRLSTNIAEPDDFGTAGKFVLDTGVEGSEYPAEEYPGADVVIGRDAVFFRKDAAELRTYLLKDYPDTSVTKEQMISWMDRYGWSAIAAFIFFAALLYWLFFMLGMAVYVMIVCVLALLAGKVWRVRMEYGQWLAVGFHAVTLPILVDIVLDAFGSRIPYSFSFIFVLFVGAVIADERAAPAGPVILHAAPRPPAVNPAPAPAPKPPAAKKARKIAAEAAPVPVPKTKKPRKPRKKTPPPPPQE